MEKLPNHMTKIETIPDYLARMRIRDQEKHGSEFGGLRTTQEISEYFNITTGKMKKILDKLAEKGLIESFGRCALSPGRPYLWSAVEYEDPEDPDDGEPMFANDNDVDDLAMMVCQ